MELIVCSDQLLIQNFGRINNICKALTKHIKRGNKFLLTTHKMHGDLLNWDLTGFMPSPNLLDRSNFNYTHLSCEDGLLLYDAQGKVINYQGLSQNAVSILKSVEEKDENIVVFETRPYPNIESGDIVSICYSLESLEHRKEQLKLIDDTVRSINTGEEIICEPIDCSDPREIIGYGRMYEARPSSATEETQIAYLKEANGILDEDVLDLRNEDPANIESKILAFRRRKSKFWRIFG